jgi:mRNA interferase MazF
MKKGDIVLIPFPFSDLSGKKTRPALILHSGENHIIVSFVSTNVSFMEKTDLLVTPTYQNGLKKNSLVRLDKIASLDKNLAVGLLGRLDVKYYQDLDRTLKAIFLLK